jgi:hypothetical protein
VRHRADHAASPPPGGSHFWWVVLVAAVAIVALGGAVALVLRFTQAAPDNTVASRTDATLSPSAAASAIRLGLQDRSGSVTLTWTDPSNGSVPFVVAYGVADGPADRTQRLVAGTTTITINGLNPQVNYCFTVAGIESTTAIALSHSVCTRRAGSTPSGSTIRPSPTR